MWRHEFKVVKTGQLRYRKMELLVLYNKNSKKTDKYQEILTKHIKMRKQKFWISALALIMPYPVRKDLSKRCRTDVDLKRRFQHHYGVYFDRVTVLKSTLI